MILTIRITVLFLLMEFGHPDLVGFRESCQQIHSTSGYWATSQGRNCHNWFDLLKAGCCVYILLVLVLTRNYVIGALFNAIGAEYDDKFLRIGEVNVVITCKEYM